MKASTDVHVGDELPSLERIVTREDVKAYADAGGDQNLLHQDDAVAREAGFDGIIAHGMFTMGHMVTCVVAWCGDPAAVISLSAHFRTPVFMGETIVAGGRVTSIDAQDRSATIETWVSVQRGGQTELAVRKGQAVVRLN